MPSPHDSVDGQDIWERRLVQFRRVLVAGGALASALTALALTVSSAFC
jgi:hypothetical protein